MKKIIRNMLAVTMCVALVLGTASTIFAEGQTFQEGSVVKTTNGDMAVSVLTKAKNISFTVTIKISNDYFWEKYAYRKNNGFYKSGKSPIVSLDWSRSNDSLPLYNNVTKKGNYIKGKYIKVNAKKKTITIKFKRKLAWNKQKKYKLTINVFTDNEFTQNTAGVWGDKKVKYNGKKTQKFTMKPQNMIPPDWGV